MGKRFDQITSEATSTVYDDLMLIEHDPSITKVSKKITVENFRQYIFMTDYLPSGYVTDGSVDYSTQLVTAYTAAANKTLLIPINIGIASAVTIPLTVSMIIPKGGKITKLTGGSLAINGPFEAGLYQVFSGFTTGDVTGLKYAIPQWFGAKGDWDGTTGTDDSTAIQAAINSLSVSGLTIGTNFWPSLFFPKGAYKATGLVVTKPLNIYGESKVSSILKTVTNAALLTITLDGTQIEYQGAIIHDLSFIGNGTGTSQNGIVISPIASFYEIYNSNIGIFGNDGIYFNGGASLRVHNSWIELCKGVGINILGKTVAAGGGYTNGLWIRDNVIRMNKIGIQTQYRIVLSGIENNIIESNNNGTGDMGSVTRPGIGIKILKDPASASPNYGMINANIRSNYFENQYQDMYIEGLVSSNVRDNYFDGNMAWTATYNVDAAAGQFGRIIFDPAVASYDNIVENNNVGISSVVIAVGEWDVLNATTLRVWPTGFGNLVRYKTGAYAICEDVGVLATISNAVNTGALIELTVDSTTSFNVAKKLLLFTPQVSGLNGVAYRNRAINNKYTIDTDFIYVDPEAVYDGQCILIGARGMRGGMKANVAGTSTYNTYAEKVLYKDSSVAMQTVGGNFSVGGIAMIGTTVGATKLRVVATDAINNAVVDVLRIEHLTTGTAAAGIGTGFVLYASDANGTSEEAGRIQASFPVATHSGQTGRLDLTALGAAAGTGLSILNNGYVGIGTTVPGAKLDVRDGGLILTDVDVVHGITTLAPTNAFGQFKVAHATQGGMAIWGLSDTDDTGLEVYGIMGSTNPTVPAIIITGAKASGTGWQALGSSETVLRISNFAAQLVAVLGNGNVGIGTVAPDGQLSTGLVNGQQISYKSLTELTTIAAAATTDTTIQIPANVIVKAVSVRVTVAIPTAATFTVIGTTTSTAFNTAAVSVNVDTTNKGNLSCPYNNAAAQTIRITPNATPADNTGRVRVTIWYEDSIPPTS